MTEKKQAFVLIVALLVLLQAACGGNRVKSLPEQAGVAQQHKAPHWSYEDAAGPAKWGTLSSEWKICGVGHNQSPIDIEKTAQPNLLALNREFKPASLKIIHHEHVADVLNNGHSIQVNYSDGDTLTIGDQQFQLVQYHFHSPSEHTVGGKYYPMEMHLVHKAADGTLAVIGVFIEEGQRNAAFDEKATPGPLFSTLDASFKTFIFDTEAGYRLYDDPDKGAYVDVLGGVRVWHVNTKLDFGAGILPALTVERSRNWVDGVGGLRGRAAVSEKLFVTAKFDLGGGGSNFTYQIFGGGGYNLTPKVALIFGYRVLEVNYDKDNFIYDMNQRGPIVGASFRF